MYAKRIININVNKKRASLRDIFIFGNPLTGIGVPADRNLLRDI